MRITPLAVWGYQIPDDIMIKVFNNILINKIKIIVFKIEKFDKSKK